MKIEDNFKEYNKNQLSKIKVNHYLKEKTLKACREGKVYKRRSCKFKKISITFLFMTMFMCIVIVYKINSKPHIEPATASVYKEPSQMIPKVRGAIGVMNEISVLHEADWGILKLSLEGLQDKGEFLIQPMVIEYQGENEVLMKVYSDKGVIDNKSKEAFSIQEQGKSTSKIINWKYEKSKIKEEKITLTIQVYEVNKKAPIGLHKVYLQYKDGMFLLNN